jgi:hypothetical protein
LQFGPITRFSWTSGVDPMQSVTSEEMPDIARAVRKAETVLRIPSIMP